MEKVVSLLTYDEAQYHERQEELHAQRAGPNHHLQRQPDAVNPSKTACQRSMY